MAITKPHKSLTPRLFIKKLQSIHNAHRMAQVNFAKKVEDLQDQYARQHAKIKKGDILSIPENVPALQELYDAGYDQFRVTRVIPEITQGNKKQVEEGEKPTLLIGFIMEGLYIGEGLEPRKGTIRPNNDTDGSEN